MSATTFEAVPVAGFLGDDLEAAKTGLTTYAGRQYMSYVSKDGVVTTPLAMVDMDLILTENLDDEEENSETGADGEGTVDGGAEGDNTEEDEKPEEQPEEEEKSEPISNAELKESMDAMIVKLEKYLA